MRQGGGFGQGSDDRRRGPPPAEGPTPPPGLTFRPWANLSWAALSILVHESLPESFFIFCGKYVWSFVEMRSGDCGTSVLTDFKSFHPAADSSVVSFCLHSSMWHGPLRRSSCGAADAPLNFLLRVRKLTVCLSRPLKHRERLCLLRGDPPCESGARGFAGFLCRGRCPWLEAWTPSASLSLKALRSSLHCLSHFRPSGPASMPISLFERTTFLAAPATVG